MPGLRRKLSDADVIAFVDAGKSPRSRRLEKIQSYHDCTAYDGRPSWWDSRSPLQERAPCIVYPFVARAVNSNVAFAMGEGKFPTLLSMSSEDDDLDQSFGLSKNDSGTLDAFNAKMVDLAGLATTFRSAAKMAQAACSVALILCLRKGLPCVDLAWSKTCVPEFDPKDPSTVTKLTIRYRYVEPTWFASAGEFWPVVKEYLRIIDVTNDTTYLPAEIWDKTDSGPVTPDPAQTRPHGFSFCPVVWYAHRKEASSSNDVDGQAIHQKATTQVEALDFTISQRFRAGLYAGDPQWSITGVSPDDGPGAQGRRANVPVMNADVPAAQRGFDGSMYTASSGGGAIRKGPGEIWRTESPDATVTQHTLPGDALKSLQDNETDLLRKLSDSLGVVIVDGSTVTGAGDLSGRTLAFVFSSQINLVSEFRDEFGRNCILPVVCMFYRMLLAVKGVGVYLPGVKKALPVLQKFQKSITGGGSIWVDPQIKLKWGDYFDPSDTDEATRVNTAIQALTASPPLITHASAVEHIKSVFAIQNVDQYVDTILDEAADRAAKNLANTQAMVVGVPVNGDPRPNTDDSPPATKTNQSAAPSAKPGPAAKAPRPKRGRAAA